MSKEKAKSKAKSKKKKKNAFALKFEFYKRKFHSLCFLFRHQDIMAFPYQKAKLNCFMLQSKFLVMLCFLGKKILKLLLPIGYCFLCFHNAKIATAGPGKIFFWGLFFIFVQEPHAPPLQIICWRRTAMTKTFAKTTKIVQKPSVFWWFLWHWQVFLKVAFI